MRRKNDQSNYDNYNQEYNGDHHDNSYNQNENRQDHNRPSQHNDRPTVAHDSDRPDMQGHPAQMNSKDNDTKMQNEEFDVQPAPAEKFNKREMKDQYKKRDRGKFDDLTKMDFDKKQNSEDGNENTEPEVQSRNVISPDDFEALDINSRLKEVLAKNGFVQMTNIQKECIPVILESSHVLVKSETGSGKTLAYCVPLVDHLLKYVDTIGRINRDMGTFGIIFSPTRELCIQIENTLKKILKPFNFIVPGCLMGGENAKKEKSRIRKGLNLIICTPGRLLYHLQNTQCLNFQNLQYLIFDESDRILDMGFEREMTECLKAMKQKASHLFIKDQDDNSFITTQHVKVNLVSATLGKKVNKLSMKLIQREVRVGFDNADEDKIKNDQENLIDLNKTIPASIKQTFMRVPNHKFKMLYLLAFLNLHQESKIIVFMSTCDCVNYLSDLLKILNWLNLLKDRSEQEENAYETARIFEDSIYCLHGKMPHSERKMVQQKFDRLESGGILISTDVASRGLDFKQVKLVIQFDVHPSLKEYANRIGRTARLNETGSSLIFINEDTEKPFIDCLINYGAAVTEMNRFKMLQDFTKLAQDKYHREGRGTRVFRNNEVEIEDEKFEILLFLKMLVRDTLRDNENLDKLEKQV